MAISSHNFYKEISKIIDMPPDCKSFVIRADVGECVIIETTCFVQCGTSDLVTTRYKLIDIDSEE